MSQLTDAQLITEATVIKTETALGANTADRVGTMFVDSINSKINIDVIDPNIALGTSDSKIPTQNAVKTYADGLVVGLLDDRGSFTPSPTSPGDFPSTGGSGTGGAIEKGDIWFINVAGYINGFSLAVGASVRALASSPGQDPTNWDIIDTGLGIIAENVLNKSSNVNLGTSNTLYPTQNAVKSYVDTNTVSKTGDNTITGNNSFTGTNSFIGDTTAYGLSVLYNFDLGVGTDAVMNLDGNPGTSGQVLTSQGGAATPTWETPTPGISPADNTTFTGDITFNQNTEFTAGITTPLASTSVINGTLDLNYIVRADGSTGTAGQVLTSNGAAVPTWQDAGVGGGSVTTVKVTLESADILGLTVPFTLIAAPGAGKILNVLKIIYKYNYGTVVYFGTTSLFARLGGLPVCNNISSFLSNSESKIGLPAMTNSSTTQNISYINQALELININPLFSGDGTLDVYITYDTITL